MTTQAGSADLMTAHDMGRTSPPFDGDSFPNSTANIGSAKPVWIQFQEWLSRQTNDDGEPAAFWRDPFQRPATAPTETEPTEGAGRVSDNREDETVRPEDLRLELRAVIIGTQGNLAVLGDQVVEAGSQIAVNKKGRTIPVRITTITNEHASVEIGDKEYELRLPPLTSIRSP